jgi:hypothetical protein
MAKRYHSSEKLMHRKEKFNDEMRHDADPKPGGAYHYDREDSDSRSSERAMHRMRSMMSREYYAGPDPRRRQEMEDAGMIHEDHNAVANLPQNVVMKPYGNATGGYLPEDLDDTIRGINRQTGYDGEKRDSGFYPKKV